MEDWRHVPGPENIADIATRQKCKPADFAPGSVYQCGPSWLNLVEKECPVKTVEQVKHSLPPEELNLKLAVLQCMTVTVRKEQVLENASWTSYLCSCSEYFHHFVEVC